MSFRLVAAADAARPITVLTAGDAKAWLDQQPPAVRGAAAAAGFKGEAEQSLLLPDATGAIAGAAVVTGPRTADEPDWAFAALADALPEGAWQIVDGVAADATAQALGWALGTYAYTRYKPAKSKGTATLVWPAAADRRLVEALAGATTLGRDLITTPANDLGPGDLADAARAVAARHGADISVIVGDQLLAENYPAVHAVGRASSRPPCLIDMIWGDPSHPTITLVGKGVCFDSGGYDIKPSAGMKMMKKDMGGAATVLALADAAMAAGLKLRLRVLIPAVENLIAGNAFKPMDVLKTRKGMTVEVGNTDAEGRLILADALHEAASSTPDLIIDVATLTGAARVALGPELPVLFGRDDALVRAALDHGTAAADPLWQLPLWAPYRKLMDSKVADINSIADSPFGGAIIAGLFLAEFVPATQAWLHIDTMAWLGKANPGRPEGGEPLGLRALFRLLASRQAA